MSKKPLTYFSIIILAIGLVFLANGLILAWTVPTAAPPAGNVAAPINVGGTDQTKAGRLDVDTSGSAYWLTKDGNSFSLENASNERKFVVGQDGNAIHYGDLMIAGTNHLAQITTGDSSGLLKITGGGKSQSARINLYGGSYGTSAFTGDIVFETGNLIRMGIDKGGDVYMNNNLRVWGGIQAAGDICTDSGKCLNLVGSGGGGGIASCDLCDARFVNTSGNDSINGTLTVNGLGVNGNMTAYDVTGDKFIDRNNTSFYVDPLSTSVMNEISLNKITAGQVNTGSLTVTGNTLMGYEQVSNTVSNIRYATANCPTGKKILGGGCATSGILMSSYPLTDAAWSCRTSANSTIAVYALCARVGN